MHRSASEESETSVICIKWPKTKNKNIFKSIALTGLGGGLGVYDMLGGAGPRQGQYPSVCFPPVHVCERDVVLFVTAPQAHGRGLFPV